MREGGRGKERREGEGALYRMGIHTCSSIHAWSTSFTLQHERGMARRNAEKKPRSMEQRMSSVISNKSRKRPRIKVIVNR